MVAGKLGGRNFDSPPGHRTHPMSEKARGAIFNALGELSGLTVLDAFAGSGALAIEAISRGAESVLAIEVDKYAYETVQDNIKTLQLDEKMVVMRKNISGWSRNNQDKQFDVVLVDPPYDDIRPDVIERLGVHVKPGGIFVLSWPGSEPVRDLKNLEQVSHKEYGDIQLVFYRRIS
ncbi:MAG TPA: RsmD family RNA methyltransferase [Candidatus Microsaccharimonas sp.]|nr:RsmD family RNA methyltransferase [Candidatus Microsaccharimonas sp.]